jgi:5-methylcytosine-specific restriction enzyme subunit McrC
VIPIENIYFLLMYAWNTLDEGEQIDVDAKDSASLLELLARVLISGVDHARRRGFDRSYVGRSEEIAGVRGRLLVSTSIATLAFKRGRAYCEFDDLSHDTLPNQIVKTTLARLVRCDELDRDLRAEISRVIQRMSEVSEICIAEGSFRRVQLHRNNAFYRLLLEACKLVALRILPEESRGKFRFRDFVRDEQDMWDVFQRFVRNFFDREQTTYKVSADRLEWLATSPFEETLKFLPGMITDVSLKRPGEHIVIETKYYKDAFTRRYEQPKLHSEHLFQIFAYLQNIVAAPAAPQSVQGVLLYPAVGVDLQLEYEIHGCRVRVATVNLDQPWREIRRELLGLIQPCAPAA